MITREQISALPAGRQLDALVTETVLGTRLDRKDGVPMMWTVAGVIPMFSTNMSDAWRVIEHMHVNGFILDIFISHVFVVTVKERKTSKKIASFRSSVDESPHAVCIASLLALLFPLDEANTETTRQTAHAR